MSSPLSRRSAQALLLIFSALMTRYAHCQRHPKRLDLYIHEDRVTPASVIGFTFPNNRSTPTATPFGTIFVFDNRVTKNASLTSTTWAREIGSASIALDGVTIEIGFTIVFNSSDYTGTISCQGALNFATGGDLSIVGGTGDFANAYGKDQPFLLDDSDPSHLLFLHRFSLNYLPDFDL